MKFCLKLTEITNVEIDIVKYGINFLDNWLSSVELRPETQSSLRGMLVLFDIKGISCCSIEGISDTLFLLHTHTETTESTGLDLLQLIEIAGTQLVHNDAHCRKKYTKIDLSITFLLLIIAIVLEIYAALFLLYSDQSTLWLDQHKKVATWIKKIKNSTILKPTVGFLERMVKLKRWSNQIGQYSVTCLCLKEKHGLIGLIYKISRRLRYTERLWEDYQYTTYKQVHDDLKKLVFEHVSNMKLDEETKEENLKKRVPENVSNKISNEIEVESSAGDDKKNDHIKEEIFQGRNVHLSYKPNSKQHRNFKRSKKHFIVADWVNLEIFQGTNVHLFHKPN
ncbi:hypothetical protein Pint_21549 [Pistacia integerrima]|uniref:Uncharacterized protein n=1 Tax=Pistacia integerrima TaxID=434235 RepID=A0ACC0XBR6_9ROSI|nr:hypothetical protein Pint_21549 [Pistacia integerrima]